MLEICNHAPEPRERVHQYEDNGDGSGPLGICPAAENEQR